MSTFGYAKARRVAWSHTTHIISRIIKMMIVAATSCRRRTRKLSFFRTELSKAVEPRRVCEKFVYALCDRHKTHRSLGVQFWLLAYNRTKTHTRVHAHARTYHCIHTYTSSVYTQGECHCFSLHTHIHFVSIHARWMPLFIIAYTHTLRQYTRQYTSFRKFRTQAFHSVSSSAAAVYLFVVVIEIISSGHFWSSWQRLPPPPTPTHHSPPPSLSLPESPSWFLPNVFAFMVISKHLLQKTRPI